MKSAKGTHLSTELLESHHFVVDLLRADYPVLSLYTDGRRNWAYLWSDTDSAYRHRYLLFTISRAGLVEYLEKKLTLRSALLDSATLWLLEEQHLEVTRVKSKKQPEIRRHLWRVSTDLVTEYLPAEDSYFDESMAPDVDLSRELLPKNYDVPIRGTWFSRDFEYLFKRYERLYAFFYATRPRFVRTINTVLHNLLRAPWTGGYSRVNLYTRLAQVIPALHTLKVDKLNFASPGDVKFEAIPSIGASIAETVLLYLEHEDAIDHEYKIVKKALTSAKANKVDLSKRSDGNISLSNTQLLDISRACSEIGRLLRVEGEFSTLHSHCPNTVVFGKAVNSFVRQLFKLANLQRDEMLDFGSKAE